MSFWGPGEGGKLVTFGVFFRCGPQGVPGLRCGIPYGGPGMLFYGFWARFVSVWVPPGPSKDRFFMIFCVRLGAPGSLPERTKARWQVLAEGIG